MVSCAPGKRSTPTYVDVYCDSCFVKIQNMWYDPSGSGNTQVIEYPFEGIVDNYKRIEFNRFDSPNNCVRPIDYVNYSVDWTWIYIIENGDTTASLDNGGNGYCN